MVIQHVEAALVSSSVGQDNLQDALSSVHQFSRLSETVTGHSGTSISLACFFPFLWVYVLETLNTFGHHFLFHRKQTGLIPFWQFEKSRCTCLYFFIKGDGKRCGLAVQQWHSTDGVIPSPLTYGAAGHRKQCKSKGLSNAKEQLSSDSHYWIRMDFKIKSLTTTITAVFTE